MSAVYPANGSVCSNNKQSTAKGRGGGGVIGVAAAGVEGGEEVQRIVFGDCQIICCIIYASCF